MRKPYGKYVVLAVLTLTLLLGVLLTAGPASAATKTAFTTTITPLFRDPEWFDGYSWESGMTAHLRAEVEVLWWESSDPRLTGRDVSVLEGDAHWYGAGPVALERGKFTFYVRGGGVWEGSYTAQVDSITWESTVTGVGHGVSGSVAGLRFDFTVVERSVKSKTVIAGSGNIYGP